NRRYPLVFLPSHRSYVDAFVLGDVLARNDFPPNHVIGGANLRFWPMGLVRGSASDPPAPHLRGLRRAGAPARPRNGCVPFAPGAEAPVSGPPSAADAHTR
uniref:hypothetical protein n=1 Tax=Nocardia cyriacigeorgica TaxID=135487 RepID=UPI002457698A